MRIFAAICGVILLNAGLPAAFGQYISFDRDEDGTVYAAYYQGNAGWLTAQRNEKSKLHLLPELIWLKLQNHDITRQELAYVATLQHLEMLVLGDYPEGVVVDTESLNVLRDLDELLEFHLCKHDLSRKDLVFLAELDGLEYLTITGVDLCDSNAPFRLDDECLRELAAIEGLKSLSIRGVGEFSNHFVAGLAKLPHLTALDIASTQFTDEALEYIASSRQFEEVDIWSPHFTDAGVKALCQSPDLRVVVVHESPHLTERSLLAAANLPKLQVLELPTQSISRESLEAIAQVESLERLILRNAEINDDQLLALKNHPSLQGLNITSAVLSERSLEVFKSLEKLEYVILDSQSPASQELKQTVDEFLRQRRESRSIDKAPHTKTGRMPFESQSP